MKFISLAALAAVSACLGGCSYQNIAEKALGQGAIKVSSSPVQRVLTPGIYKIVGVNPSRGYTLARVCANDFLKQNALKALATETQAAEGTIDDDNLAKNLSLTVPAFGVGPGTVGGTLSPQVTVDRATKYKVVRIGGGYNGSLADYMINNVASNCSKNVLHGDLVFVGGSANADTLSRVTSGGATVQGTLGPLQGKFDNSGEKVSAVGSNITFGVTGEHRNIP